MKEGDRDRPSITEIINRVHLSRDTTIGAPARPRHRTAPLVPSINLSAANEFADLAALEMAHADKFNSVRYARDSSELIIQAETYLSAMHASTPVCVFQSGMAAIDAALTTLLGPVEAIVTVGLIYRKSSSLIRLKAQERRIPCLQVGSMDALLQRASALPARLLIVVETPSNPFLELQDVHRLRELFPGARILVDITLQGLVNDRAGLPAVADVVVASCTKYAGGHNDILAGYAAARDEDLFQGLWEFRSMRGCILDSLSAYLLIRSLRTYDLRIERQVANARAVLSFLGGHDGVEAIYYPGRHANSGQSSLLLKSQYHGGSVLTFRTSPSVPTKRNIDGLLSTKMAPSFGSIDSLIEIPAIMSHWGKPPEELALMGIDEHLVRLSVGIEPLEFIAADLESLLSPSSAPADS
jgi:cystathionine beta-lyase/cystathionine gamma-synthase